MTNSLHAAVPAGLEHFSQREREIIAEIGRGFMVREIAAHLGLTINTVKDYIKTIYSKAQVHSARELLIHLYGNPDYQSQQRHQSEMLRAFETVLAAPSIERVTQVLVEAARICAGAQRVGIWRAATLRGRAVLVPLAGGAVHFPGPCSFFQAVVAQGHAIHGADPKMPRAQFLADARELATLGLEDQILGFRLHLDAAATLRLHLDVPDGHTLLLLSKLAPRTFSDLEISTCRLLARVAETHCAAASARAASA